MAKYEVALIQDEDDKSHVNGYHFEVRPLKDDEIEISVFNICFKCCRQKNSLGEKHWATVWVINVNRKRDVAFAKRMLVECRLNELKYPVIEIDALRKLKKEV